MQVHEGGCLCGAVRYQVRTSFEDCGVCHCRMCQRWTGGPFFHAFTISERDVSWTGTPAIWRSSDIAVRAHCGTCGTPLYWKGDATPGSVDIAVATLDQPNAAPPRFHMWTEAALDWPELDDGLRRFPRDIER